VNHSTAPWPHVRLDVPELRAAGQRPVPFRQFVVKVHSRCNLACRYCYVYEMADSGWRNQPQSMTVRVAEQAVRRIAEHVRAHDTANIRVVLHGGEPLLAGGAFIQEFARAVRRALPPSAQAELAVQTNGTLVAPALLDLLARNGIRVGVSLDGDEAATDRHRRYRDGRGSYDRVARALELLGSARYRDVFNGLLCTVSLDNDPVTTYETLRSFGPPTIDFLLPHATWSAPPPSGAADHGTPYADWLLRVFRRWTAPARPETSIRLFEAIIALTLGGASPSEAVGLTASDSIVIDTDGAIKQVDALYAAYDGAADTGLNVFSHALEAALDHPTTVARQIGRSALSGQCLACPVVDVCGGGFYPHRYRAGEGFKNPSVYCADLLALIGGIQEHVVSEVSRLLRSSGPTADR
jgi:uncharacterized protein